MRNLSWTGEMEFEGEEKGGNVRSFFFFTKLSNNNITAKISSWLATKTNSSGHPQEKNKQTAHTHSKFPRLLCLYTNIFNT